MGRFFHFCERLDTACGTLHVNAFFIFVNDFVDLVSDFVDLMNVFPEHDKVVYPD